MTTQFANKKIRTKLINLAHEYLRAMKKQDFDHVYENLITPFSAKLLSIMAWPLICYLKNRIDFLVDPQFNPNPSIPIIDSLSLAFQMNQEDCRTGLFQGIALASNEYGWNEFDETNAQVFIDKQSAILVADTPKTPIILIFVEQKNGEYLIDFAALWLFSMNMKASLVCEIADHAVSIKQNAIAIQYYSIASKLTSIYSRIMRLMCDHPLVGLIITPERKMEMREESRFSSLAQQREKLLKQIVKDEFTPQLNLDEYEKILQIVTNMAKVIERNPEAFQNLREEHVRNHFLVQLNGQYSGNATGETFNYTGKTDIMLRQNDVNLFVAECKFWKSPHTFSETIDQILRYATWRDTYLAIMIFNRKKNLSDILEHIPNITESHPSYFQQIKYPSETGFRFLVKHPNDAKRHLLLTILVFEIPE